MTTAPALDEPTTATTRRVLIVEDDAAVADVLRATFERSGEFTAAIAASGLSGLDAITSGSFELLLLDLRLPDVNGLEVLRRLRRISDVPVIVLTALGDQTDRIVGLELGADDYVVKPCAPREILARARSVLRRSRSEPAKVLKHGRLVIELTTRRVILDGVELTFTAREFDLLAYLAQRPDEVVTRDDLIRSVWNSDPAWQTTATVTELVHRIRRRFDECGADRAWISTARGVGYRFSP